MKNCKCLIIMFCAIFMAVSIWPVDVHAGTTHYEYKPVYVKKLSKQLGSSAFASSKGDPGITISINSSKTLGRSYSYTANGNIKVSTIATTIGWSKSQTKSESLSISNGGSWKVPTKANNKKVKQGILRSYCYYDRIEYKVMRREVKTYYAGRGGNKVSYGKWKTYKTGCIAKKPRANDVVYKKSYVYK